MPVLLYCVAEANPPIDAVLTGVARLPVFPLRGQGLVAFASRTPAVDHWRNRPLPEAALEFHHVLQELFRSTAILPFRFPTILESHEEWNEHLNQRAADYRSLLSKFRTSVQLEALVTFDSTCLEPGDSGTEYLRAKQKRADSLEGFAGQLALAAGDTAKQWRTRLVESGIRCVALVERALEPSFREAVEKVPLPEGLKLRLTGPWPATEFLNLSQV